jgi:HlyD family secretion protein
VEITPSEQQSTAVHSLEINSRRGAVGPVAVKLGVFVVVTSIIAVGAYFGARAFLLNNDETSDDRRPVAVQRGTLLDDVTASGSVSFPELESLRFEIGGTVAELLVDEGDEVVEGQQLILLDKVTIAALESAVADAKIALKDAGESLAELLSGATSLERAIAESNLADARVASMDAAEDLAELLSGTTSLERAIAESNLADARVASMNAAEDLAEFTTSESSDSPATITAKEALTDANEALADVMATADDDAAAQDELVSDAQKVLDESITTFSDQISGWFGNVVVEEDRLISPTALAEKWGTSVDQIFDKAIATAKSPQDDPATPWNENIAWVWTHLSPFPVLTNCEDASPTLSFRCPSAEIDDTWDAKVAAEESLAEVVYDAATALKGQQVLIDAAQTVVEDAAEDIVSTVNDIEINALAATLAEKVELEKDAAEDIVSTVNDIEINALEATLAEKIELEKDAEATISDLSDLDDLEIKSATATVNEANALLDAAKTELAATNLLAPFDGVITSISVSVGDPVNRTTPTIDILDPTVVIVDGSIDEIDVLSLNTGDAVSVILDALPDQPLVGVIDEIGDGLNLQGVIEFPLIITLTPPDEIELIEGLSATATIVLNQIDNALLIPLQAVGGSFTQATVDVVSAEGHITTDITLGASDDFWVIVESGLTEGQEVLMTVADENVDPFTQFIRGAAGAIPMQGAGGGGFSGLNGPPGAGGGQGGRGR